MKTSLITALGFSLLCFAACSSTPIEGAPDLASPHIVQATTEPSVDAASCVATGGFCDRGAGCCEGSCNNDEYGPTFGTCLAPFPAGSSCRQNSDCASSMCENYLCVAPTCKWFNRACTVDGDCCAGSFCANDTYSPWRCTAIEPDGGWCYANKQCLSGNCVNYQCAAAQ